MRDISVAILQSNLFWEEIDANLAMFEEKIRPIQSSIDLILLPEMFSSGFSMNAEKLAEPFGGKTLKWMKQMAKIKGAAIAGSFGVKEGKNFYNRLSFVYPNGDIQYYDKKHLFTYSGENKVYTSGDERKIFDFLGWRIKPLICYDLRFPVWSSAYCEKDNDFHSYDLLLYVANWPKDRINAWDTLLKARAIENSAYCVGVNITGVDGYRKRYLGHSAAYDFQGKTIVYSEKTSDTLIAHLSGESLNNYRKEFSFLQDADAFQLLPID